MDGPGLTDAEKARYQVSNAEHGDYLDGYSTAGFDAATRKALWVARRWVWDNRDSIHIGAAFTDWLTSMEVEPWEEPIQAI